MIDIETEVFDRCARAVLGRYPDAFCTSEQVYAPASFPAACITESSNITNLRMQDNQTEEQYADVVFTADVYSDLSAGGAAKKQCRDIAGIIDETMAEMGIRRTFLGMVDNLADSRVCRYTARFAATVRSDGTIFRRS